MNEPRILMAPDVPSPIRILIVEDNPADAELIGRELRRAGFEVDTNVVVNESAYRAALAGTIDLIVADYMLDGFDVLRALEILHDLDLQIPLIVVTGAVGEERAVECLHRGAADYLLKDRLGRLVPAVRRAVDERRLRIERQLVDEAVVHDQRLAAQYRQAQKMEAIGQLAGGLAHDFNNLLTTIIGYCELARHDVPPGSALDHDLGAIRQAADSAAALTHQLLAFSRQQFLAPVVLDLNDVVRDVLPMLRRLIREDIGLVTELAEGLRPVQADSGQVQHAIVNLAVNARDAVAGAGRITIATGNADLDHDFVRTHIGAQTGSFASLSISDTGVGMADEIRTKVFEPFFTTKGLGRGTGLGLSTVYGIVKQSGGYIDVTSEPGHGSTFTIYFPALPPDSHPGPRGLS